jgi:hypothetical protein
MRSHEGFNNAHVEVLNPLLLILTWYGGYLGMLTGHARVEGLNILPLEEHALALAEVLVPADQLAAPKGPDAQRDPAFRSLSGSETFRSFVITVTT